MKQFSEFSKEDQRLICEAMRINNDTMLNALDGKIVDNSDEFEACINNMSKDAKLFLIEILKGSLPEEYIEYKGGLKQ